MKLKIIIISLMFSILLISCKGNTIYYDIENKGVVSCDGLLLNTLVILEIGGNSEYYYINSDKGVHLFKLKNISKEFVIRDKRDNIVSNSDFKLKPLSQYKITNISIGDAGEQWVIIKTDKNREIIEVDKTQCEQR
jgi:hypothetical protein